jgi:hypothetical protein
MGARGWHPFPSRIRDRDWLDWFVIPPCLLACALAVLGVVGGLFGEVYRSFISGINDGDVLGYVPPNGGWVALGMAGGVIAAAGTAVLAIWVRPRWLAAVAAWSIVLLQAGWLVLADRMAFFQGI